MNHKMIRIRKVNKYCRTVSVNNLEKNYKRSFMVIYYLETSFYS